MLHVLRSPLIVSENIAFLCHDIVIEGTQYVQGHEFTAFALQTDRRMARMTSKTDGGPVSEADALSSISTFNFVLNALALK